MVCCLSCSETLASRVGAGHSCSGASEGEEGGRRGGRCRGAAPLLDVQHPAACRGRLQPLCLAPARGV